jgi:chromate transporter
MSVEKNYWLSEETFKNGVALCQIIPGATAVQMSAYVGLKLRGVRGAALSFVGFAFPAFILMTVLSALYVKWHNLPIIISLFIGLRAIIIAIIGYAAITFGVSYLKKWKDIIIAVIAAVMFYFGVNPVLVILTAVILGLMLYKNKNNQYSISFTSDTTNYTKSIVLIFSFIIIMFIILFFLNQKLFELATLMFRIDLFAFGGGFAAAPLMYHEIVDVRSWIEGKVFLDGFALGQITPGPVIITATFMGYLLNGLIGAIIATISIFTPSFLMVIGISPQFDRIKNLPYFKIAINGILSSFVGLLSSVFIKFALNIQWNFILVSLASIAFILLLLKIDTLWIVLGSIIISIVLKLLNVL